MMSTTPVFDSWQWRAGNWFVSKLAKIGVGPIHLLTTRGRRTGQPRTVPVVPVERDDTQWLVAPYGAVSWVHDVRADGAVQLRHGRSTQRFTTREASSAEAGPVLKEYVNVASKTRPQFDAAPDAPVAAFVAEADRHPVFELVAAT